MEYKNRLNEGDISGASQTACGDGNSLACMAPEHLCVVNDCTPKKKKSAKERIEERKRANEELNEAISMNDIKKYTKDRPVRYQIEEKPVNVKELTEYEKHRHELLKKNEEKRLRKTTNLDYRKSPNYNPLSEIDPSTQFQDGQADEFLAWYYETFNN